MNTGKTLLLIDDDIDEQGIMEHALSIADSSVKLESATSCEEALKKIANESLLPDLIFLDLNFPGLTGKECLIKIKELAHLRHIPIAIYTTSENEREKVETQKLGANHFITKPFSILGLVQVLKSVL